MHLKSIVEKIFVNQDKRQSGDKVKMMIDYENIGLKNFILVLKEYYLRGSWTNKSIFDWSDSK